MGCDIHAHLEVKIKNPTSPLLASWYHYSIPNIGRNYDLFAKMANVRNSRNITPISKPKGLPPHLSVITQLEIDDWGTDGHSHSWLDKWELRDIIKWQEDQCPKGERYKVSYEQWGYIGSNSIDGFVQYHKDNNPRYEDIRLVFWFDN